MLLGLAGGDGVEDKDHSAPIGALILRGNKHLQVSLNKSMEASLQVCLA